MRLLVIISIYLAILTSCLKPAGVSDFSVNSQEAGVAPEKNLAEEVPTSTIETELNQEEQVSTAGGAGMVPAVKEGSDNVLNTTPSLNFKDNNVLFAPQAPYGVWDDLHEETCEEASMIMAVNFFRDLPLGSHIMEQGLLKLVAWQEERGYKVDLDADEVVEILDQYFDQPARVLTEVSVDSIIAELNKGNLLIVPAAGRNLGNPYFTSPGPVYHMLVIRGYDKIKGQFITNDPGTKNGEAYRYSYSRLLSAIAEWDHDLAVGGMTQEEIEQGRRVLVIVQNPQTVSF